MNCSSCGTTNPPGSRFCGSCGTPLSMSCPNCGTPAEPGLRFCRNCGAELPGQSAPAAMPLGSSSPTPAPTPLTVAPTAERRVVSVLFADLVGFTSLSEARDAEEVRELLTRYFDLGRQIVGRYGGVVEKFIGDAVMAVWGTPLAQEDDAERAVRAALDLVQAVAALGDEIGSSDLKARAGVLTGEAAVTIGAEGQGMVAGDLVNTASRIQGAADPGTVLVGEVTRRSTEAAIVYQEAGAYALKGKAERVPLWRAVRVVAARRGAQRASGLEAPFVGRDRELRLVKELFHGSAEERKAHLVSVIGVAGIGKSRLTWEFEKYIDGVLETIWWHRGRCLAYGEGVTYWALAEMVRMRARIVEGDEPATALAKLAQTLELHVSDPEERRWIEPRLAHLLGLEERSARDREDLFAAWRLFFERMASVHPTILVFEDLQWADASLLDFIEYLLEWSRDHPLFILTLARPELSDRRAHWGAGHRNFTSLFLEPLSPDEMAELLRGLVPGLPEELAARILERAEGVPLYAVETVRMLLDRGLLRAEGNEYRPVGTVEALDVPETLHALIAARLDGLTPGERRLLQDASVMGKYFTKAALSAVTGLPEAEIEANLTSLTRKEILSIQIDPRSPEHGQYGFLQDLVKRVAYETLSKKDRKARHLAAASFLETRFGAEEEEVIEVIASHYLDAYRAAPDAADADDIRSKARGMLVRAGERAASLAASEEAQRYYELAIELVAGAPGDADLHERAGDMAWRGGRVGEAKRHFELAMERFDREGRSHPGARVSAKYAAMIWVEGRGEESLARLGEAFEILSKEEPDADLALLAAEHGRFLMFSGRNDEAMERLEFALDLAETRGFPEALAEALDTKGLILEGRGRLEEGRVLLHHSLQVALDHEVHASALRAYNNIAASANNMDRHDEELEFADRGIELARKFGIRSWEWKLLSGGITPRVYLGRWDEALEREGEVRQQEELASAQNILIEIQPLIEVELQRGDIQAARRRLEEISEMGRSVDLQLKGSYSTSLAAVRRSEGRHGEALEAAEGAFGTRAVMGMRNPVIKEAFVEAAEAAFALGNTAKVEELIEAINQTRASEVGPFVRAHVSRFGARLAAGRGETDSVESNFKQAAGLFREMAMPFWLAVTQLEHAEWLTGQGRRDEAAPLLGEAGEIFDRLRAAPWIERLHRALGGAEAGMAASGVSGG
jgi:class 3 adenylate cyclase/tetratricopeptide (TPR) repeat protein